MERFVPIVHTVLAVFTIVELGLTASLVSPGWWWSASTPSFMLFNSIWSLLVLAYVALTPMYAIKLYHNIVSLVVLWITTIFWFAGSIALAVWYGSPQCHGNTWCGVAQAAIAFGFFIWAMFTFLAVIETLRFRRGSTAAGPHTTV
ncbi:hypothetical protein QBC35DRAFT_498622 [Podospora australis]|uniref:MARVEL domain-containing protein n=1 Tax=Podospora australis TaxID=1536484 RepID=A0AAN6WT26_9PEZI|nr:hypothetical protein QBC35DRAFT_498622 [Podospora australis]